MFQDGWVCRACWKPNRPGDTKCYRCKTDREADRSAIEAGQREREAAQARIERQRARVPDAAVVIPAAVFQWLGRFSTLGVIVLVFGTAIVLADGRPGDALVVGLFTIGYIVATFALRWISREMRVGNALAFGAGLAISAGLAGFTLWALTFIGSFGLSVEWFQLIPLFVYGVSAISSLVGLLYALRGDDAEPA